MVERDLTCMCSEQRMIASMTHLKHLLESSVIGPVQCRDWNL